MTLPQAKLSDELCICFLLQQYYLVWTKFGNDPDENVNRGMIFFFNPVCDAMLFWQTELETNCENCLVLSKLRNCCFQYDAGLCNPSQLTAHLWKVNLC